MVTSLNYAPMLLPEAQLEAFIGEALANNAAMTAGGAGSFATHSYSRSYTYI